MKNTETGIVEEAQHAILDRRNDQWKKALRAKLGNVRDEAMELQAMLEFVHGQDAPQDDVWQFASRTVRHAELIMSNPKGELEFPVDRDAALQKIKDAIASGGAVLFSAEEAEALGLAELRPAPHLNVKVRFPKPEVPHA